MSGVLCSHCRHTVDLPIIKGKVFIFMEKYQITINLSSDKNEEEMITFFDSIIEDIDEKTNPEVFKRFDFFIDEDIEYKCSNCGNKQTGYYTYSLNEEFRKYLKNRIYDKMQQIVKPFFIDDIGYSDLIELYPNRNTPIIMKYLPRKYEKEKILFCKICEILEVLPEHGGSGGDVGEFLDWILQELKSEVFEMVFQFILIYGFSKSKKLVMRIINWFKIRKKIKSKNIDWSDLSFDDIEKSFSIPKKYIKNKEKIVKWIIINKTQEYEKKLLAKLKKKI